MGAPPIYPHIDPGRVSGLEPSMIAVQQAAIDTAQAVGTLATTVGNIPPLRSPSSALAPR